MSELKGKNLEQVIGYTFSDPEKLKTALTHSSYANEHHIAKEDCNERMEFLGDAVLELITSEFLFLEYPNRPEGELTKIRASIVCESTLAYCAEVIHLGEELLLGKGEDLTGGRYRPSVISDALEAVIGAIYLDGGFANAKEFIHRFILDDIENKQLFFDSKTILQELIQSRGTLPLEYELIREEGPDHNKIFEVCVRWGDHVIGTGTGRTKKGAEQVAAYHGIVQLRKA